MHKQKLNKIERTPLKGIKPACYGELYDEVPACWYCLLLPGCSISTGQGKALREKGLIPKRGAS